MLVCRGESLANVSPCPHCPTHAQTLKASIYLEYLFIFYMTRHKKLQLFKLFKRKKYNSLSRSSSFQGTDMIGGEAPRSNREVGGPGLSPR